MKRQRATTLSALVLLAALLAGCGSDEEDEPVTEGELPLTQVERIVANPGEFGDVRLEGRAAPLGSRGFVLHDETGAILALSLPSAALRVDKGAELVITGQVRKLAPWQLENVRAEIRRGGGPVGEVAPKAVRRAPFGRGAPYIELTSVSGEGNVQGSE